MPRPLAPEKRTAVLEDVPSLGVTGAARKHGVGKATVSKWANAAGVETVPNEQTAKATEAARLKREWLRELINTELLEKARDMLARMDQEHIDFRGKDADQVTWPKAPASACQSYATATAILIDKSQLLSGGATSRTEHVEPIDAELARLVDAMKP
jgi:transposase-like protein